MSKQLPVPRLTRVYRPEATSPNRWTSATSLRATAASLR
jgi:hypothetical protein